MVFSSLSFLFCFFPAFLLVYYLTPSRPAGARNAVLLVGSCVFYVIGLDGQWAYFALLAASVLVNYGLGLAITRDKPRAKLWLIVGLCYNFLWLFLFKYLNFLLTGVNGVLGSSACSCPSEKAGSRAAAVCFSRCFLIQPDLLSTNRRISPLDIRFGHRTSTSPPGTICRETVLRLLRITRYGILHFSTLSFIIPSNNLILLRFQNLQLEN